MDLLETAPASERTQRAFEDLSEELRAGVPPPPPFRKVTRELEREIAERLRSLGYLR